jgi:hypothetical protein
MHIDGSDGSDGSLDGSLDGSDGSLDGSDGSLDGSLDGYTKHARLFILGSYILQRDRQQSA